MVDASMSLLKEKASSTRNAIVNVLGAQWPLSAKALCNILLREKAISVSYQAVHKTLAQLEDEGIIERTGREYQLNKQWIAHVKQFGLHLEEAYSKVQSGFVVPFADAHRHEHVTYTFDTIIDYGRFLINYFFQHPNPLQKPCAFLCKNTYMPIGLSKEELGKLKTLWATNKYFVLVASSSVIDKFYGKALIRMGCGNIHFRFGVPVASDSDILVVGDYILRMYLRSDMKKELFERSAQFRNLEEFDLDWLFAFMHQRKTELKVQIDKDPTIADQLRTETLSYFKEETACKQA